MNRCLAGLGLALVLVLCLAAAGPSPWTAWAWRVPIERSAAQTNGLQQLELSPEVLKLAQRDLADLRVIDAGTGAEIPYVIEHPVTSVSRQRIAARLYNRSYLAAEESSVTADLGEKALFDRVEIRCDGQNFRRRARIEAGDDGLTWRVIAEHALLFQIGGDHPFTKNTALLGLHDFRYLRVTVFNGDDDPARISIDSVAVWRTERHEAPVIRQQPVMLGAGQDQTRTVLQFDAGQAGLGWETLRLDFADRNFWRRVEVWGREAETAEVSQRREDGAEFTRREDVPWQELGTDVIYRFSDGGNPTESLVLELGGTGARYLKVLIENQDDRPLTFVAAELTRRPVIVAFPAEAGRDYALLLGNARARAPQYDLGRFADRLLKQEAATGRTGLAVKNPDFGPAGERPGAWTENYRWAIWLVLLVAVAVLGLLVFRQVRGAPPSRG